MVKGAGEHGAVVIAKGSTKEGYLGRHVYGGGRDGLVQEENEAGGRASLRFCLII